MKATLNNVFPRILLQSTLVLTLFGVLGSYASAEELHNNDKVVVIEQLFESQSTSKIKQYIASLEPGFVANNLVVNNSNANSGYDLKAKSTHIYGQEMQHSAESANKSWPLLSLNIQKGNADIAFGTKY